MFRKKKPDGPKYYRTLEWNWSFFFLCPLGYSVKAVTEYDPNDTYELFCHDVYGVHPRFIGGWPSNVYFSPVICLIMLVCGLPKYATFLAFFVPGWALFVTFANWYFTTYERSKYE